MDHLQTHFSPDSSSHSSMWPVQCDREWCQPRSDGSYSMDSSRQTSPERSNFGEYDHAQFDINELMLKLYQTQQTDDFVSGGNCGGQRIGPVGKRCNPNTGRITKHRHNNRNYQEARYKTELCLHYRERGNCPHGQRCLFAHGTNELRPYRGRHPKHKTQFCKAFHETGYCNYGYRCSYIHLESPTTIRLLRDLNSQAQATRRHRSGKTKGNRDHGTRVPRRLDFADSNNNNGPDLTRQS